MSDHKQKGHQLVEYDEFVDGRTAQEHELIRKEQRVSFWEKKHKIPTAGEL